MSSTNVLFYCVGFGLVFEWKVRVPYSGRGKVHGHERHRSIKVDVPSEAKHRRLPEFIYSLHFMSFWIVHFHLRPSTFNYERPLLPRPADSNKTPKLTKFLNYNQNRKWLGSSRKNHFRLLKCSKKLLENNVKSSNFVISKF